MTVDKKEFLLIGPGGIGCMGAFTIDYNKKVNCSIVVRRDYEKVKENGYTIDSIDYGKIDSWKPSNVFANVEEAANSGLKFDYVAVATKNISDIVKVEDLIEPIISENTVIVLIQNGFGIDKPIIKKFPKNICLSGVSHMGSHNDKGHIHHIQHDKLVISPFENPNLPTEVQVQAAKDFIDIYANDKVTCIYFESAKWYRYRKLVYNATLNTTCALTGVDTGRLDACGGLESIAVPAMKEVVAVAAADGITLPEDVVNLICHGDDGDYFEPSMLVDVKKGNPIELEAILGSLLDTAEELKVPTPTLSLLYKLLQVVQFRLKEANGYVKLPEKRPISDKFYS